MANKIITVDIAADGSIKIEGHGFTGASCEKATKFLQEALGTTDKVTRKAEYLLPEQQQQRRVTQ